jgi:pterin-4a-carbinolamine dehydratase
MAGEPISDEIQWIASGRCVPCKDAKTFTVEAAVESLNCFLGWSPESGSIQKEFRFKTYRAGLDFAYSVGTLAEEQGHHPDMHQVAASFVVFLLLIRSTVSARTISSWQRRRNSYTRQPSNLTITSIRYARSRILKLIFRGPFEVSFVPRDESDSHCRYRGESGDGERGCL